MAEHTLHADYLVVGAGSAGLAFTDALTTDSDARVVMVDRRHAPGGHWNDAYPFVRLHQPSAFYGVNSLPLGEDAIDQQGLNEGHYERASGPEIVGYFRRVMDQRLLPSGKVRYFPSCEYLGHHRFVSRLSGDTYEVKVSKKLVDARDSLLANRRYFQPGALALEGFSLLVEAAAQAKDSDDLVGRAIASEQFFPLDEGVRPTMFKYATVN